MTAMADRAASIARDRLDALLAKESKDITYAEIAEAVKCVIAWRNAIIEAFRAGAASREALDRANALVSLAYGAEYPLVGLHRDRIEQARGEMAQAAAIGEPEGK